MITVLEFANGYLVKDTLERIDFDKIHASPGTYEIVDFLEDKEFEFYLRPYIYGYNINVKTYLWLKKYFNKSVNKSMSTEDALDHSILKWEGLQVDILEEYGLFVDPLSLLCEVGSRSTILKINCESCALCAKFISALTRCKGCPLAVHLGRRCDDDGPYNKFLLSLLNINRRTKESYYSTLDTKSMLDALKATKAMLP